MGKFKIGDKVWCTREGVYSDTDYHVPCVVFGTTVSYGSTRYITVVTEKANRETGNPPIMTVWAENFELIPLQESHSCNPENDSGNERTQTKEVNKMEKPVTKLEKKSCLLAKEEDVEKAVNKKKEAYKMEMETFVDEEHCIINEEKHLKERKEKQKERKDKLGISKEDMADLF